MDSTSKKTNKSLTLSKFLEELRGFILLDDLTKIGDSEKRTICRPEFGQLGLLFLRYFKNYKGGQFYITENQSDSYYYNLSYEKKEEFLSSIKHLDIPAFIICGKKPLKKEIELFKKYNFPLIYSYEKRIETINKIEIYLNFIFAEKKHIHGVLMDVLGIGILIKGKSGIGKSEVALDLLERKHRLVADDLVVAHRRSEFLIGYSLDSPYSHYIEARGIGLIDIRSLFGIQSIRHKKRIEILIELIKGDDIDYKEFDRIRVKSLYEKILGIKIPKYIIPVTYSKNLANLIEVIALAHIANIMGESPINSINESIAKSPKSKVNTSYIDTFYFISDNE